MIMKIIMRKTCACHVISVELIKKRKHLQACHIKEQAYMFTSHPKARVTFNMLINLFLKLLLTISFYLFYFSFTF